MAKERTTKATGQNKPVRSLKEMLKKAKPELKKRMSSDSASAKKKQWKQQASDKKSFKKGASAEGTEGKSTEGGEKKKPFKGGKKPFKKSEKKVEKKPLTPAEYRARKPHYQLVESIKTNWNRVRDRSVPADVREKLVEDMCKQVTGHVMDVTLRHDASRMVQAILQFGTDKQKEAILVEMSPKMHEVAKTPYGHFTVLKAITYCTGAAQMKRIATSLKGHFVSMACHVIGARVVESILQIFPSHLTRNLKAEFYGGKFTLLCPEVPKSLNALVEMRGKSKMSIMDHMRDILQRFVKKGLLAFTFVHLLLHEYSLELQKSLDDSSLDESEKKKYRKLTEELIDALADAAPKMLATKPGAKTMCFVITHSNAKDRKRIIKSLKGHTLESLLHDSAFLGIMRLIDVNDDTVNIQKSFFDELKGTASKVQYTATGEVLAVEQAPWLRIATHPQAHKVLLRLLTPAKRNLEPDEEVLFNVIAPYSKKSPEVRRKEHIVYIRQAVLRVLGEGKAVEQLMRSRYGSRVLESLIVAYRPANLVDSVARVFAGLPVLGDEEAEEEEVEEEMEEDDEEEEEEMEEDDEEEEEEEEDMDEVEEDEAVDEDVEDEEYAEQMKEAEEDLKTVVKQKKQAEEEIDTKLPIHEDAVAHQFIKRIFKFEATVQNSEAPKKLSDYLSQRTVRADDIQKIVDGVDTSLWAEENANVATALIDYLKADGDVLSQWLQSNRACFALHELLTVPAVYANLKEIKKVISKNASYSTAIKSEGGKLVEKILA